MYLSFISLDFSMYKFKCKKFKLRVTSNEQSLFPSLV